MQPLTHYGVTSAGSLGLLVCCKCGRILHKPVRRLANSVFIAEVYKCQKCSAITKIAYYTSGIAQEDFWSAKTGCSFLLWYLGSLVLVGLEKWLLPQCRATGVFRRVYVFLARNNDHARKSTAEMSSKG